jgi:hypothetical protein
VHTKTHNHPAKGSYRPKAVVRGTLVLVPVERLRRQTRIAKRLWLWWRGPRPTGPGGGLAGMRTSL